MTPLTSRATINYSLLTRYIRQSSAGQQAINLHVRSRHGPQLYTLTPDHTLSCDLCAIPAKTDPPCHFQGWSSQSHQTYPPCTGNIQGFKKQLTQRPSPGAHVHKPQTRTVPLPLPKRPNKYIQSSSFKVYPCLSSTKLRVNRYITPNCASPPSLNTFGTPPTPMNWRDSAKASLRVQKAQGSNAWKAQTSSDSSSSPTFPMTDDMKCAIPW